MTLHRRSTLLSGSSHLVALSASPPTANPHSTDDHKIIEIFDHHHILLGFNGRWVATFA